MHQDIVLHTLKKQTIFISDALPHHFHNTCVNYMIKKAPSSASELICIPMIFQEMIALFENCSTEIRDINLRLIKKNEVNL